MAAATKPPSELCVVSLMPLWSVVVPVAVLSPHRCSSKGFCVFLMSLGACQGHISEVFTQPGFSKHSRGAGSLGTWAYTDQAGGGLDVHTLGPQQTLLVVAGIGGSGKIPRGNGCGLEERDQASLLGLLTAFGLTGVCSW